MFRFGAHRLEGACASCRTRSTSRPRRRSSRRTTCASCSGGAGRPAHVDVAQQFVDAGYDHLALMNAGPDPEGFFDFFASELAEPLRKLTPSS